MKTLMRSLLIVVTLVGVAQSPRAGILPANEREALLARAMPALAEQRAGAGVTGTAMQADERATLASAQSQAPDLAAQRGGDLFLTDHDLAVAGVTLLVFIALVIIF